MIIYYTEYVSKTRGKLNYLQSHSFEIATTITKSDLWILSVYPVVNTKQSHHWKLGITYISHCNVMLSI